MYHKSTHQDSKERILTEFKSGSSRIRCIITTVALGMGLDIRDVQLVVHIGCPKSILSYWQEAGRCARDGRQLGI
jgi:ATP-dependent DNA helicase RecQ